MLNDEGALFHSCGTASKLHRTSLQRRYLRYPHLIADNISADKIAKFLSFVKEFISSVYITCLYSVIDNLSYIEFTTLPIYYQVVL